MSPHKNFTTSDIKPKRLIPLPNARRAMKFYHTISQFIATSTIIVIIIIATSVRQFGPNTVKAEYFSSVDVLQQLGDVEMELLHIFRHYLQAKQNELESYKRFIEHVKLQHSIAIQDVEDYLGNPINAFTLIKRMVSDWANLHESLKNSTASEAFRASFENLTLEHKIPDENDLKGAVKGLVRLQKVYELSTEDLVDGIVYSDYSDAELDWDDCFQIATSLFDLMEYSFALKWFEITLNMLNETRRDANQRKFEIETLEYLALTHNELGETEKAIKYINEILKIVPDHHTKDILSYLMHVPPSRKPIQRSLLDQSIVNTNYTRLCRGIQMAQNNALELKCTVETLGKPQFTLAPLKIEQLNLDPIINVYHGLLTDTQIDQIIEEAETRMERSAVLNGNDSTILDVRVSQQAWLDYKIPAMKYIRNLVGDITGLDLSNAELMQMANYGIGGVYEPHHDYVGITHRDMGWAGDRTITNMFYLSDVEQGGFTVFPLINVFSRPQKGSMVLWYNLYRSLEQDERTLHAGCPVVMGSKRIGNVWIHSDFQEFRRPCHLKNDKVQY